MSSGTLVVRVVGDTSNFESKMNKMASSGAKIGTALAAPLAILGVASVKTAMDYEQSMNVLQASSEATADQMKQLGDLAVALGNDLELPGTSAADAAEAMTELVKAGLSVNDTMAAAKGVLQMSAAGNLSNAQAAEIAANALNAFRMEGSRAVEVADMLAGAANASSAEVVDMADGFKMGAAVWSAAGFSAQDLTEALGLLANAGIKGSDAGTSLKQMLLMLQSPSKVASGLMKEIGFSAYDASGSMKSMDQILADLKTSTAGMTQQQKDFAISTIFGADAVRAINVLMRATPDEIKKMETATTKAGAAADLAAAKNKGLKGALDALRSTAETFLLQVGVPMLSTLADWATELSGTVNWIGRNTEVLGPLAAAVGAAGVAILSVSKAFGVATAVARVFGVTLTVSLAPIYLIAAAVAVLAVGLVYAYNKSETFRNIVQAAFRAVGDAAMFLKTVAITQFQIMVNMWLGAAEWIVKGAARAFGWVPGIGGKLKGAAGAIEGFRDEVNAALNGIKEWDPTRATGGLPSLNGVKGPWSPAALKKQAEEAGKATAAAMGPPMQKAGAGAGDSFLTGLGESAKKGAEKVARTVSEKLGSVLSAFGAMRGRGSAQKAVNDATRELNDLLREQSSLPADIAAAEAKLAKAREASKEITPEERREIVDAEDSLAEATRRLAAAQRDLTDAQTVKGPTTDDQLDLVQAQQAALRSTQDLAKAQADLAEMRKDGKATATELKVAELEVTEKQLQAKKATDALSTAGRKAAATDAELAEKAWDVYKANRAVTDAEQDLAKARTDSVEETDAVADAEEELNDLRERGKQLLADIAAAQDAVTEAKLSALDAELAYIDTQKELRDVGGDVVKLFEKYAAGAKLSREEVEKLTAALENMKSGGGNAGFSLVPAPGGGGSAADDPFPQLRGVSGLSFREGAPFVNGQRVSFRDGIPYAGGKPVVPAMADGGIVRARAGGTLVRVGEAGQDEAIVPLGRGGAQVIELRVPTLRRGEEIDGPALLSALMKLNRQHGPLPIKVRA